MPSRAQLAAALGLGIAVLVASGPCAGEPAAELASVNREVGVEATGLSRAYKEVFGPGVVQHDRENGWAAGVLGRGSWIGTVGPISNAFVAGEASWNRGNLTYRGTLFNSATPITFQSDLSTGTARGEIGKGFELGPRLLVIPVLEGGYLWWRRDLGAGQTEDYRAGFAGAGVRANLALSGRLVASARVSADTLISPAIRISYAHSYDADLGARPRYDASLGLDYRLRRRLHLTATADWTHYGFGESGLIDTAERGLVYEPTSHASDLRLGAGLAYAY
ncbi:MAG: hypothetical protein JWQ97_4044 [Phenylobacterium sp.]|nr:hypothetical protein [Phenylobacterium sp.]